jgi:hypothetical protein
MPKGAALMDDADTVSDADLPECQAVRVPPARIGEFLPIALPLIERATARCGDWTADEVVRALCDERMLLWFVLDDGRIMGIAVTEVVAAPATGRVCSIVLCAGAQVKRWIHLKRAIEAYARAQGCTRMRLSGRRGWARLFPDYRQPYVTLEKAL